MLRLVDSIWVYTWDQAAIDDYYEILIDRESSAAGTVNSSENESVFIAELYYGITE